MSSKYKSIEVSSKKSFFGGESEMDKEIAKWTSKGWVLVSTTASNKKDCYLLSFQNSPEKKSAPSNRMGCVVLFGIAFFLVLISNSQKPESPKTGETTRPTSVAQMVNPTTRVNPAQVSVKSLSTQVSTLVAIKTETLLRPTLTPTRKLPTATIVPTQIFASVKSGTINARECPSTDCSIVTTVGVDDELSIIGLDGNWYLVGLSNGNQGYIRSDLLTLPDGVEVSIAPTIKPNKTLIPTEAVLRLGEDEVLIAIKTVMFSQGYPIESIKMENGNLVVNAAFSPNDSYDDPANVEYQISLMGLLVGSSVTAFGSDYTTIHPPTKINIGFTISRVRIFHVLIKYSDGLAFIQHKITADQLQDRLELVTD